MITTPSEPIWEHLADSADADLRVLVAAAVTVLDEACDDPRVSTLVEAPPRRLGAELSEELASNGVPVDEETVARLLRDEALNRPVVVAVLQALGSDRELRAAIDDAYRAQKKMMFVDAGVLLAGALLMFVMKLKHIKVGKAEVSFYEAKAGALDEVGRLLQK